MAGIGPASPQAFRSERIQAFVIAAMCVGSFAARQRGLDFRRNFGLERQRCVRFRNLPSSPAAPISPAYAWQLSTPV